MCRSLRPIPPLLETRSAYECSSSVWRRRGEPAESSWPLWGSHGPGRAGWAAADGQTWAAWELSQDAGAGHPTRLTRDADGWGGGDMPCLVLVSPAGDAVAERVMESLRAQLLGSAGGVLQLSNWTEMKRFHLHNPARPTQPSY